MPPLALKNIGAGKNQNKTTGKLTRTTMNTTQIRDKPIISLKGLNTHKMSNVDSNDPKT